MSRISCFLPFASAGQIASTLEGLRKESEIANIYLVGLPGEEPLPEGVELVASQSIASTKTLREIAALTDAPYTLIYTKFTTLSFGSFSLERMLAVAEDTGAGMVYADHFNQTGGVRTQAPVIDCQEGALRDDFDFGSVLLYKTSALKEAVSAMTTDYQAAGLYDLRLRVSQKSPLVHIGEYLYYDIETDTRKSGEKLFDYVDPKNRSVQIEMENACTEHLKAIGAYLSPQIKEIDIREGEFEYEASVVIPCKNRVRTIGDAIKSALSQKTDFPYNVIVVDDNSDDGTVDVIKSYLDNPRLVYIAQDTTWHGIGGNWNAAAHHPKCGRFALQLDSDDVYSDENTVQRFVDAFRKDNCAMVIGTYQLTDIDMNPIPPGVIDHREWTDENGRNNALRINGLGAPRGFYTPLLRKLNFPVTKYGEDYAVGLRISREWRIGRIYEVMYNCRRWDNNSDASLDIEKVNANNYYKDKLRTIELQARKRMNLK